MKKLHCALICLLALTLAVLSAAAAAEPIETGIRSIQKYGTLELTVSGNSLLEMGYEYGDIVTVTIDGKTYDMPVVSSYNDVDSGCMLCQQDGHRGGPRLPLGLQRRL